MGDVQGRNNVLNRAQKYTLNQFNAEFPDDDACLEAIKEMRFPGAVATCDKCKVERKHYGFPAAPPMPATIAGTTSTRSPEPSSRSQAPA